MGQYSFDFDQNVGRVMLLRHFHVVQYIWKMPHAQYPVSKMDELVWYPYIYHHRSVVSRYLDEEVRYYFQALLSHSNIHLESFVLDGESLLFQ